MTDPIDLAPSTFPLTFPFIFGPEEKTPSDLPDFSLMPPGTTVVPSEQIVSLHSIGGIQLYQFPSTQQTALAWSRDLREVSRCELEVPSPFEADGLPDIVPWLHWVSVWSGDGDALLWTGPIEKVTVTRTSVRISARDMAALMTRTRVPLTKRWEAADPAVIAAELWEAMIDTHGLNVSPIVRPDPEGDRFDFEVTADSQMMDAAMADLVGMGLRWSVVSGIPILGPAPLKPVTALCENDFLGTGMTLTRDGSATYNNVLLRGADNIARARRDLSGLDLQQIVNLDSMFGVSNVDRAVKQYVRYTASIRDALMLPDGSVLHPSAPISIEQLIPSARFVVEGYGLRSLMELEAVDVADSTGNIQVSVKMESVLDVPELMNLDEKKKR